MLNDLNYLERFSLFDGAFDDVRSRDAVRAVQFDRDEVDAPRAIGVLWVRLEEFESERHEPRPFAPRQRFLRRAAGLPAPSPYFDKGKTIRVFRHEVQFTCAGAKVAREDSIAARLEQQRRHPFARFTQILTCAG